MLRSIPIEGRVEATVDVGSLVDQLDALTSQVTALTADLANCNSRLSAVIDTAPRRRHMFVDAIADLGCVAMVRGERETWSDATASENVRRINEWLDSLYDSTDPATLVIPRGTLAINDTLGATSSRKVDGYANGEIIRGLPPGVAIECGGGWANGRYFPFRAGWNTLVGGLMWVGEPDKPMIRLLANGNRLRVNLWGYPYVTGTEHPNVPRCRSGIELYQLENYPACGHHDISGTITGCEVGIRCEGGNHADHLYVPRLTTRDCLAAVLSLNEQAVGHHFGLVEHYGPRLTDSVVFDYATGGRMVAHQVLITSNYGCIVLRIGHPTLRQSAKNGAYFEINGLGIDRAVLNATSAPGGGRFRLIEQVGKGSLAVRMRGTIAHGGSIPGNIPWFNAGGEDPVILAPESAGTTKSVKLDIWGLDEETAQKFPWS